MATAKKAAKSAKKAPQPVKKTPAKKAVVKKAAPAKAAPKKAAPKKAAPAKAAPKGKAPSKPSKPAAKVVSKVKEAPKKAAAPAPKPKVAAAAPLPKKAPLKSAPVKTALPVKGSTATPVKGTTGLKPLPAGLKPLPAGLKSAPAGLKTVPSKSGGAKTPPSKPAPLVSKPLPPYVKPVEPPKSTVIARPTPKPETKMVEIKPIKTSVATTVKYEPDFKSVLDEPGQTILNAPTMRYSDAELAEFKDLIMRKLEAAKKELTYLQGLITRKDEMGGDESENRYMTMEDGSISMEREQLSQMASRQIQFIDHLEKALMRIENKTYGICRVTGKLIDKARLRAVPHATLSIEAKMGLVKKSENQNVQ
jgi:RNA polymerase-binding transcription factor DksA